MNVWHLNVICKPGVYGGPGTGAPLVIFGMGFLPCLTNHSQSLFRNARLQVCSNHYVSPMRCGCLEPECDLYNGSGRPGPAGRSGGRPQDESCVINCVRTGKVCVTTCASNVCSKPLRFLMKMWLFVIERPQPSPSPPDGGANLTRPFAGTRDPGPGFEA